MTSAPGSPPPALQPLRAAVLATEGVSLASLHIFCDIAKLADAIIEERRASLLEHLESPWQLAGPISLRVMILSVDGQPVRSAYGERVPIDGSLAEERHIDLLMLPCHPPGWTDDSDRASRREAALSSLIPEIWNAGAIVAAVGSGVVTLARSGILDGRTATVARQYHDILRRDFPAVRIDPAQEITDDSNILCASYLGSEAILATKLVARITAKWLGVIVARLCLPYFSNSAGSSVEPLAAAISTADPVVSKAALWIARNFSQPLDTAELAASLSVSSKTLVRRFQRVMHVTPHAFMRELRLDGAAVHLRKTNRPIAHIAARAGYGSIEFFSQLFRGKYGIGPMEYRRAAQSGRYRPTPE